MNHLVISEVRRSWNQANMRKPVFSQLFCTRMHSIAARRGLLFGNDAEASAESILRIVGIAVNGLQQPHVLLPFLKTLGQENADRFVDARQNCLVIHALILALRTTLGSAFNRAIRHAWMVCYRSAVRAVEAGMADSIMGIPRNVCPEVSANRANVISHNQVLRYAEQRGMLRKN